ncbi:hypothetical protein BRAO375_4150003 [Bradyrhizobium sp. ORS 375]|nr:hypothetical protein BRAO375_4150003 [Bradyrhizobium sp. ORS 375]
MNGKLIVLRQQSVGVGGATCPRPLRGEVGLRSNPGEGHGTDEASSQLHRIRKASFDSSTTREAAPLPV